MCVGVDFGILTLFTALTSHSCGLGYVIRNDWQDEIEGFWIMQTLTQLSEELGELLRMKGWVLTTAESCTGGGISAAVTDIAGSSLWFDRAFITYSNEAKIEMLSVEATTLEKHGAVSQQVVQQMAEGAVTYSRANVAISVSGIAGPGGGSLEKPVGTVWFGWKLADGKEIQRVEIFQGNRKEVREQACCYAIRTLIELAV